MKQNMENRKKHTCPICGKTFYGYGNNAQPVANGLCCDDCNTNVVVPCRMGMLSRSTIEKMIFSRR